MFSVLESIVEDTESQTTDSGMHVLQEHREDSSPRLLPGRGVKDAVLSGGSFL